MEKLNDNQPTSISEETTEKGMTRRQVIKTGAAAAGAMALIGDSFTSVALRIRH